MRRAIGCLVAILALYPMSGASGSETLTQFTALNAAILPNWCQEVLATRDGEVLSEIRPGDVMRVASPGRRSYGYRCKLPGHGGSGTTCEDASVLYLIFGLNLDGNKEGKITTLCLK